MAELRILVEIVLDTGTIRLWDGQGGPYVDASGNIYRASQFTEDALQQVEAAINGEAFTLSLALISVPTGQADAIWDYDEDTPVTGSEVVIKIQEFADGSPAGSADVVFTGTLDNMTVSDVATEDGAGDYQRSQIVFDIVNSFTLRTLSNGGVLSDVDQRARSAILNPGGNPDRFCERIPTLLDHTIKWPSY